MVRFAIVVFGFVLASLPAEAALITFDISGTARTGSNTYGIAAGDVVSGSLTLDDDVRKGKGKTGDVESFEFRIGDTVFDLGAGELSISYELRDDALFKLDIHARTEAFRKDYRQFVLNLAPNGIDARAKDLDRDWIHVDNIVVERPSLFLPFADFNANLSSVSEPASLTGFVAALGLLGAVVVRRRRA